MLNKEEIVRVVQQMRESGLSTFSSGEFAARMEVSLATAKRYLDAVTKTGELIRQGTARCAICSGSDQQNGAAETA